MHIVCIEIAFYLVTLEKSPEKYFHMLNFMFLQPQPSFGLEYASNRHIQGKKIYTTVRLTR